MSDGGEVWISPSYFFFLVGNMRLQTALGESSALSAPTTGIAAGASSIEALMLAVDEARTMFAASMEIAGRALTLAGTEVTSADMAEEQVGHMDALPTPYPYDAYESPEERAATEEAWIEYSADVDEFVDATPSEDD